MQPARRTSVHANVTCFPARRGTRHAIGGSFGGGGDGGGGGGGGAATAAVATSSTAAIAAVSALRVPIPFT
jgi:hypothetical protein